MPQYDHLPVHKIPNLFVPDSVRGYDKMIERSKVEVGDSFYLESDHTCHDGEIRSGIWVPYSWWIG